MNRAGFHTQKNKLSLPVILLAIVFIFSACQAKPNTVPLRPDSNTPITNLLSPQPESYSTQQITITPVIIKRETASPLPMNKAAWLTYTNIDYGFSFQYPPQWKLLEQDKKEPHYIKLSTDSVILIIGYKWSNEDKTITGGGTLPGTLESSGYVTLAGQLTPKILLTDNGEVKSIYYNGINAEIPIQASSQGLVLSIRLIPAPGSDYHTVNIPESTQKELDEVLNSFIFHEKRRVSLPTANPSTPVPADWKQWENLMAGFRFYYPPDWNVEEQPHLIKVKQNSIAFLIGYRFDNENINLGPDQLPPGELRIQYNLPFFNQQIPKQVLIYENKQKAVLYGNDEIAVLNPNNNQTIHFVLLGYDFQADYANIDISSRSQETFDRIVTSFQFSGSQQTPLSTVTPTTIIFLLTEPTWKDDFNNSNQWYLLQTANTSFSIKDGKLLMRAAIPNTIEEWGVSRVSGLKDFYLEGNFITGEVCSGLDRYGFIFRAPQPTEGYVVNFSCNGQYRLYIWDGSQYKPLVPWTQSTALHSGANQKNALGIAALGNNITIYANRIPLTTITDDTYPSGGFGLLIGSAETQNFTVFVEDVAYWQK